MNNQEAYDQWANTYNDVLNKTRDTELAAKKDVLDAIPYATVLELGCGTGKNTQWLLKTAGSVISVDFSENMLAKAKQTVQSENVHFVKANINEAWNFVKQPVDLVTCSLVLEHIEQLEPVFEKAAAVLNKGGHIYIGELHPFKQYAGSKARFEDEGVTHVLDCWTHHISDYTTAAASNGFSLMQLNEWFDDEQRELPRILTLLFRKN